ncbi:penicillin binding transpeptidase domain protein, partial [Chlamydia psittaci 06-1683]
TINSHHWKDKHCRIDSSCRFRSAIRKYENEARVVCCGGFFR